MNSRLSRRSILLGSAASVTAGLLAACGGSSATDTPSPAATTNVGRATGSVATGAATVRATTPGTAAAGASAASGTGVLKPISAADAFKGKKLGYYQATQLYKGVQDAIGATVQAYAKSVGADVDLSIQGSDAGPNFTKMQAGVESGNPFDLAETVSVTQSIALGIVTDVTDVVTALTAAYGTVMPIIPRELQSNGKFYAVPFFTNADAWFIRRDKFEAKGIKPETLDTYDKLRDAALEINDPANKFYGWGFSPYAVGDAPPYIWHAIHAWGGSLQDKAGQKVTFNSPETIAAVTWLADTYLNPKYKVMVPPGYESWDGGGNNNAWLGGSVGIAFNSYSLYAKAKADKNPVFDVTFVGVQPKAPNGQPALNGGKNSGYFSIPRGAKNPDLAKETIKYILQPDQWSNLAAQAAGYILPAYESQWNNAFWKSDPNFAQLEAQVRDPSGYNQQYWPGPPNPAIDNIIGQKMLEDMMASIIQKGDRVDTAVKEAHDRMVKVFEQFGLKQ